MAFLISMVRSVSEGPKESFLTRHVPPIFYHPLRNRSLTIAYNMTFRVTPFEEIHGEKVLEDNNQEREGFR